MARYEHLPIYKSALDMTVHFERPSVDDGCTLKPVIRTSIFQPIV